VTLQPPWDPASAAGGRAHRILQLSILKFLLITFIVVGSAIAFLVSPQPQVTGSLVQRFVMGLVVFEYATLLGLLAVLRLDHPRLHWVFLGTLISDTLVTTALVHVTGGAFSPYAILYMVGVISSALAMPAFWAGTVTFLSIVLYAAVSVAGHAGWLPAPALAPAGLGATVATVASRLSLNISAMAAVSALSITLARQMSRAELASASKDRQIQLLFNRHQDILRSLRDGICCLSREGLVLDVNPAFRELVGQEVEVGMSVEALPPELAAWLTARPAGRRICLTRGSQVVELEVWVQDLLVQDQLAGAIVVLHNRSELARLERDLARQEKLAAIGRLTSSIAHEIRNPLTSIAGSLELLRPSVTSKDPESAELFGIVFREIRRLNDLISELRAYTSQRPPRLESLDLVEFIQETVMLCEADPRNAGTRFELHLPGACPVSFDPGGLRQVLLNLIINAVQAAPGTWVRLTLSRNLDQWHVDIEDPGPGIPPDLQEKIFEPFVSTKSSGTGLGLAVAGHILMAHGGLLTLARTDETGTVMRMIIPADPAQT
jgi:two-component system, NtrC family, sensor histidine kinase PilS